LSGKKVAVFFSDTNLGQAIEKTKALMPKSTFVGELALSKPIENKEETKKKTTEWCNTLKIA
jgi:hypothetical protein